MTELTNMVQETTDYEQFSFLMSNRAISRNHINNLKAAISEHPEILRVQPLLCNEKRQIIDGQHRFQAASELGLPIAFTVVDGIGIEVARAMNIIHRTWEPQDFARSYSLTGNKAYTTYLKVRDDFQFAHSIILSYLGGGKQHGQHVRFRKGMFEVADEKKAREDLERLSEVRESIKPMAVTEPFANALLQAMHNEGFKFEVFMRRLKEVGARYIHRSTAVEDYLRMIEEVYNHGLSTNRLRLY